VGDSATKADLSDVASRLRKLTHGKETIDVAQLQFVGLADVQKAFGERWPEQRARIQDTAEAFLRKRIGNADILVRGDTGFLLVLGGTVGQEAHAVAAQLTHGLNAFFFGSPEHAPAPRFSGAAQTLAASDFELSFVEMAAATAAPKPAATEIPDLPDLEWRFEPAWDVRHETLSSWHVTPYLVSNGARLPGYQFESAPVAPARLLKVDEASLWVAEQTLRDLLAAQKPTLVGARVHVATLASISSRARILATMDRLNPDLHRYRLIKLAGVTPGFPRMYLNEIVGMLRAKFPNVVIGASWDEPDVTGMLNSGASGLAFTVPASSVASGPIIAVPALIAKITGAVRIAHAHRSRVLIEGGVTKFLAMRLASIGVDNISAPNIWPACAAPNGMLKWSAERLAA
jgi:hypothetical protein